MKFIPFLVMIVILSTASYTDIKYRKIPNKLILLALTLGIGMQFYFYGLAGLLDGLKGFLCGLLLLIIPFALGGMGAGDVKLLAAVGALSNMKLVFYIFLAAGIWGGVIAIILLIYHHKILHILRWLWHMLIQLFWFVVMRGRYILQMESFPKSNLSIPYAVPIFLGTVTIYIMGVVSWL